MPDFLVDENKNVIKFKTSTAAYNFLKNIDITREDLKYSSIVLLRMH
jgi:D-mannonate dehydratase